MTASPTGPAETPAAKGAAKKVRRRLTTILCADVQSYSKLMEADETGTFDTLKAYREAMANLIAAHEGRIVNTWGDAVIAEFQSVVEAVQCAIDLQRELASRNQAMPNPKRMWFRVGINLGDVMLDGEDIYGEGVNVAARLQEIAEPGGIAISAAVYEQVRHKLTIAFDFIGEQAVKNVSDPVPSYRVVLDRRNAPAFAAAHAAGSRGAAHANPGTSEDAAPQSSGHASHDGFLTPEGEVRFSAVRDWFRSQPRYMRSAIAVAGFLFFVNLMTGIGNPWFLWPAVPILGFAFIRSMGRGAPEGPSRQEARELRRAGRRHRS